MVTANIIKAEEERQGFSLQYAVDFGNAG